MPHPRWRSSHPELPIRHHDEQPVQLQVRHRNVHGLREARRVAELELEPDPLSVPGHHQIQFSPAVRRPEVGVSVAGDPRKMGLSCRKFTNRTLSFQLQDVAFTKQSRLILLEVTVNPKKPCNLLPGFPYRAMTVKTAVEQPQRAQSTQGQEREHERCLTGQALRLALAWGVRALCSLGSLWLNCFVQNVTAV